MPPSPAPRTTAARLAARCSALGALGGRARHGHILHGLAAGRLAGRRPRGRLLLLLVLHALLHLPPSPAPVLSKPAPSRASLSHHTSPYLSQTVPSRPVKTALTVRTALCAVCSTKMTGGCSAEKAAQRSAHLAQRLLPGRLAGLRLLEPALVDHLRRHTQPSCISTTPQELRVACQVTPVLGWIAGPRRTPPLSNSTCELCTDSRALGRTSSDAPVIDRACTRVVVRRFLRATTAS